MYLRGVLIFGLLHIHIFVDRLDLDKVIPNNICFHGIYLLNPSGRVGCDTRSAFKVS